MNRRYVGRRINNFFVRIGLADGCFLARGGDESPHETAHRVANHDLDHDIVATRGRPGWIDEQKLPMFAARLDHAALRAAYRCTCSLRTGDGLALVPQAGTPGVTSFLMKKPRRIVGGFLLEFAE